jgi:hypothetical protein
MMLGHSAACFLFCTNVLMVASGLALRLRAGLLVTRFVATFRFFAISWSSLDGVAKPTALHLNVASHCFNTNPLPGRVDPVRNINKDTNH